MSEPLPPIPASRVPEQVPASTSGEGAQTALAAMIRKRKMGENHVDDDAVVDAPKQLPGS